MHAGGDANPSLSVAPRLAGGCGTLLKCFAGCAFGEVRAALRRRGVWLTGLEKPLAVEDDRHTG